MDFKVSRKERRLQPDGPVDVLVDNICDLYPVFADDTRFKHQEAYAADRLISGEDGENIIMDVEVLDDDGAERLDRAMFAVMKQRGGDPVEPEDGVQWAEAIIGEIITPLVVQQVCSSVSEEGIGVRAVPSTVKNGSKEYLVFKVELTGDI